MSEKTRNLVYAAVFTAISVVLGLLSFYVTENVKISLAPAVVMFAGAVLGPVWGAAVGGATDVLSHIIRPAGAYFPGFTLTMALYGVLVGLVLHRREGTLPRVALSVAATQVVCSLLMNTMWISVLYGTPFPVLLASRVPTTFIACAIYVVLMCVLVKSKDRIVRAQTV